MRMCLRMRIWMLMWMWMLIWMLIWMCVRRGRHRRRCGFHQIAQVGRLGFDLLHVDDKEGGIWRWNA